MQDFLFRGSLADHDVDIYELTQLEDERQYRRLILIPSESTSPMAVRQALCSGFHNIYAEGYPDEISRKFTEEEILDYETSLGTYRRYSSPRYYKGVEYANIIEALARRRCAETFAANGVSADDIYVNVQPLSGAPANNAVYQAIIKPGENILGMDLLHGGHLSHGSPAHRSGKLYKAAYYTISEETEKLDYNEIQNLANIHQPKLIIAGFSSYPWQVDWARFREIADSVGAYLLADISHVAGLIAGGVYPSPIGHAHIISSTTHKTLCGPRGAIILTTDRKIAKRIDRAVFPGEQGGPHMNIITAMAVAFKLAQTDQFSDLQNQIVKNCATLAKRFEEKGLKIPFGGTNTHILNLDMKSIKSEENVYLSGDQAARILDLIGIVVNRNTIPGDRSARNPSGIRLGSPWVTQRGFKEKEMVQLADIISEILEATIPYKQLSSRRNNTRAKIDFDLLESARLKVRDLAISVGIDFEPTKHGYPHFYYIDDQPLSNKDRVSIKLKGNQITQFLNYALSSDIETLNTGENQNTRIYTTNQNISGVIKKITEHEYQLSVDADQFNVTAAWLRDLSDGFIQFDDDLLRKLPGPLSVKESQAEADLPGKGEENSIIKPYYIGINGGKGKSLPEFIWEENESDELKKTPLNQIHRDAGAKMVPFAGWDMPVRYASVMEEHTAVRQSAGLFDVSHMGVYQAEGPAAAIFLDTVCGNDIGRLKIGQSLYTHFLDPDANVIDDVLVYRRSVEKYLIVVNASNDDKDWTWLNAVRDGKTIIDRKRPWSKGFGRNVNLRNLRDTKEGKDMRVDLALQGPKSQEILFALGSDEQTRQKISKLKRTELCEVKMGKFDLVVSRTGYTGEGIGFELFVHPEKSAALWTAIMKVGEPLGVKPCGLGARDSLRTEAGLPLYGHEIGGKLNLGVGEAGFRSYVKTYKPWFIGRETFLARETQRKGIVIRYRFNEKGVRIAQLGDPVISKRGKTIGFVTSCAVDSKGFLTGQAFVKQKYAKINTPIMIFQNAPEKTGKPPATLKTGDKVSIPNGATVISRFMKR
jgi:glycine hydroxymethyltransferase